MAVTVRIPTQLRNLSGGAGEVTLEGATVAEVLKALDAGEPRPSGKETKIQCSLKAGISREQASKLNKIGPMGMKYRPCSPSTTGARSADHPLYAATHTPTA